MSLWKKYLTEMVSNLAFEDGHPENYTDELSSIWANHVNHVNKVHNFPYDDDDLRDPTHDTFMKYYDRDLERFDNQQLIIAKDGDDVVGIIQAGYSKNVGSIILLHVLDGYRSRGIGGELLKRAIEWLNSKGAENVKLDTYEPALGFYKKHGFKPKMYNLMRDI